MTLEDLANLAELVAAVGVIVSLVYLAAQIRQNTRALKSSVFQQLQTAVQQLAISLAKDAKVARLWRLANEDFDQLTDDERIQFFSLAMSQVSTYENVYYQHRQSMIDRDVWQAWCLSMQFFLSQQGFRRYWQAMRSIYGEAFRSFVEHELLHGTNEDDSITAFEANSMTSQEETAVTHSDA